MKNNNGITMVTLVVTVVILILLTGITVYTLTEDNGLLRNTREVKRKSQNEENTFIEEMNSVYDKWEKSDEKMNTKAKQ